MREKESSMQFARAPIPIRLVQFEEFPIGVKGIFDAIAYRAFEIFEGNGCVCGRDLDDWLQAESELLHPVHVQLFDAGQALQLRAEVPGFAEKELQVAVEPRRVTIAGTRETSTERKETETLYKERCPNRILRIIPLPVEIKTEQVTAALKDAILELRMPKAESAEKMKVAVKAA